MYLRYQSFHFTTCTFLDSGQVLVVPPAGFSTAYGLILRVSQPFRVTLSAFCESEPSIFQCLRDRSGPGTNIACRFLQHLALCVSTALWHWVPDTPRGHIQSGTPHCSIPHSVELGAFSLSPTSSSTLKRDNHSIARSCPVTRHGSIALKAIVGSQFATDQFLNYPRVYG
jgi:hypothetical protein